MARRSGAPSVPTKRRPCAGLPMKVRRKVSATPATFVASRPSNSSRLSTGGSCLPKQAGDAWMDCRWRTTPIRLLTGRTARPSRSSTRGRDGIVRLSQKGKGPRGQALSVPWQAGLAGSLWVVGADLTNKRDLQGPVATAAGSQRGARRRGARSPRSPWPGRDTALAFRRRSWVKDRPTCSTSLNEVPRALRRT